MTTRLDTIDDILHIPPEPAKPPSMSDPEFLSVDLLKLARDLVRKIYPPETIATIHGLSEPQLLLLCGQPGFKVLVRQERAAWEGSENAAERAKTYHREGQAQMASEIVLTAMDPNVPPAIRLGFAKLSAQIAGVDAPPPREASNMPSGAQFAVNIHLDGRPVQQITATVVDQAVLDVA